VHPLGSRASMAGRRGCQQRFRTGLHFPCHGLHAPRKTASFAKAAALRCKRRMAPETKGTSAPGQIRNNDRGRTVRRCRGAKKKGRDRLATPSRPHRDEQPAGRSEGPASIVRFG